MSQAATFNGDVTISGNLSAKTSSPVANSVNDASVQTGANLNPLKLGHRPVKIYAQPNTAATSERKVVYVIRGATAEVLAFSVGAIVAAIGAATVTFDLKKNGTTLLTGVVTLNSGVAAFALAVASLAAGALTLVAGDVLDITTVATAGGGTLPTGIFGQLVLREDPS